MTTTTYRVTMNGVVMASGLTGPQLMASDWADEEDAQIDEEDNAAIESLRTFAEQHGEVEFAHLCTAALAGEEWAASRIGSAMALIAAAGQVSDVELTHIRLTTIDGTDTTHPDGATARSVEV